MAYTVQEIINIAKISQYLSANDIEKKGLFGGGIDLQLPNKLYNIRKSVEWFYSLVGTAIPATGASGQITVEDVGNDGDVVNIYCEIVGIGVVLLGSYEKQSSDTTIDILAASIAASLNYNGFQFTANGSVIQVSTAAFYGSSVNNGLSIEIINNEKIFDTTFDNTFN